MHHRRQRERRLGGGGVGEPPLALPPQVEARLAAAGDEHEPRAEFLSTTTKAHSHTARAAKIAKPVRSAASCVCVALQALPLVPGGC